MKPPTPTVVFDTYWHFAVERQDIFFRRFHRESRPWTQDEILTAHKFTNAYRASDRVSQYLIRNVIYSGEQSEEEVYFRTLLFKLFNKIETWELLLDSLGDITWKGFSYDRYDTVLNGALRDRKRIYSAAYIMPTGGENGRKGRKHQMHLNLLEKMMKEEAPKKVFQSETMGAAFRVLREFPTVGDFLAYQYVIDLNYSSFLSFSEMDFVVPGPGARDGLRKCFSSLGGFDEADAIKYVAECQQEEFERRGLSFKSLWGRPLQLIDCQNLFCEVDKYARVRHPEFSGATGRTRIKQRFSPNDHKIDYWFPPKWGINELVSSEQE